MPTTHKTNYMLTKKIQISCQQKPAKICSADLSILKNEINEEIDIDGRLEGSSTVPELDFLTLL